MPVNHVLTKAVTTEPDAAARLVDVSVSFGEHQVFDKLSVSIARQQWTALLGRSGCGKSTVLKLLAGLIQPGSGAVGLNGEGSSHAKRRHCAYMAQNDCLLPWLNVRENITVGARLRREPQDDDKAVQLLEAVGLMPRQTAMPNELSGGMRQRVALARTLYEDQSLILMDEPFSQLDAITRRELHALSSELLRYATVVMVTHDPDEALRLADNVAVLAGSPAQVHWLNAQSEESPRYENTGAMVTHQPQDGLSTKKISDRELLWDLLSS